RPRRAATRPWPSPRDPSSSSSSSAPASCTRSSWSTPRARRCGGPSRSWARPAPRPDPPRLLVVRHRDAVPRGTPGIPDPDRALTPEGEKKFKKAAHGLARALERPEEILTSPWARALRTAEIAAEAWGKVAPKKTDALAGGSFEDVAAA